MTDDPITKIRAKYESGYYEGGVDDGYAVGELLALVDQLRQEASLREEDLRRARWDCMNLRQQLAGKQCVQCAGSIDPETLRCKECDEADAEAERTEAACARLRTALEGALPQLRHAYHNLIGPDEAWGRGQRCRFADGLIGPQIVKLEQALALPDARGARRREEQDQKAESSQR